MIVVEKVVVSDDIRDQFFVCHIEKCKGACCVEGDLGAPLEESELESLENIQEQVLPYLPMAAKEALKDQGSYVLDEDGTYSTPTIHGLECAYSFYDGDKLSCGIEKAWKDKKIDFRKPISCHLYPIRITKYDDYDALNYDRWDICSPACELGAAIGMPLFKFLKEPLIKKYGKAWYEKLLKEIEVTKAETN